MGIFVCFASCERKYAGSGRAAICRMGFFFDFAAKLVHWLCGEGGGGEMAGWVEEGGLLLLEFAPLWQRAWRPCGIGCCWETPRGNPRDVRPCQPLSGSQCVRQVTSIEAGFRLFLAALASRLCPNLTAWDLCLPGQ